MSYGYETIAEATTPEQALAGIKAANRDTVALCFVARLHQLIASAQGEQLLAYTREAQQAGDRMLTYTRRMLWLTAAVTVLTIVNVVLVAYTIATAH